MKNIKFEPFVYKQLLPIIAVVFFMIKASYSQEVERRELKEGIERTEIVNFLKVDKKGNIKVNRKGEELTKQAKITIGDTSIIKIKRDKKGVIKYLEQHYYNTDNNDFKKIENYRKNRYWTLSNLKLVPTKQKDVFLWVYEGKMKYYDSFGRLILLENYINDGLQPISITYNYYEDNSIMFILEWKYNELLNVIQYKYPDGKPYDYGDFKNGTGLFIPLNDRDKINISQIHSSLLAFKKFKTVEADQLK